MRITVPALLTAVIAFSGVSCEKKTDKPAATADAQGAAIKEFEAATLALEAMNKRHSEGPKDPASAMKAGDELLAGMKAVKTSGLPADLREAYEGVVSGMERMVKMTNEPWFPKTPEDKKKMAADPEYQKSVREKMQAVSEGMDEAAAKMKTAAAKYGIKGFGEEKSGGAN